MTDMPQDKVDVILDKLLQNAAFDGWTDQAVKIAVRSLDLQEGAEHIYAAGGALGLMRRWSNRLDTEMAARLSALDLETMRIRDKVTEAVWIRLELLRGHEDAARRAMARLSLPDANAQGAAQLWASADAIWTAIGDRSEDYNYYTKRAILSGVIGASLLAWLSGDNDDKAEARAFLQRRIENVMQFEKAKAQTLGAVSGLPKPEEFIHLFRGPQSGRKRRRARRC